MAFGFMTSTAPTSPHASVRSEASVTQTDSHGETSELKAVAAPAAVIDTAGLAGPLFNSLPRWLQQELRSDHAGEFGAVMIYRGILAISRDASVREFAESHLRTEQEHLALMEEIVPAAGRTLLLPLWRVMGWLTGALPALFGRQAVFATIEAVETFVDHHYQQQIVRLTPEGEHGSLRQVLIDCQADEVSHRDEAASLASPNRNVLTRLWCVVVGSGSAAAVVAAKRI